MSAAAAPEGPGDLPYTDELLATVEATIAAYRRKHGQGFDIRRLATGLLNAGIGLIEIRRRSFLVDLDVHTGVLQRLRAAEARNAELESELAATAGLARDLAPTEGDAA